MNATLPQSAFDDAQQLLADLQICTAAELARRGNFDSAESMLRPVVSRPDASVAALDLCARVCAQRGALGEAARFWQRVLDREPANAPAQSAMTRLNELQRRSLWRDITPPLVIAAGLVAAVVIALKWQAAERSAYAAEVRRQMSPFEHRLSRLGVSLDAVRDEQGALAQRQEQASATLDEMKALPIGLRTLSDAQNRRDQKFVALSERLMSADRLRADDLRALRREIEQLRGEVHAVRDSSGAAERHDD
jgi:hypothetical protein